ncbi:hypothetical protein Bca52824_094956 [Brassica carinata]|uniref:Bidirectional sugar transporter SWEET n=1 Tax=Brassica carinata TaxID=52824 RepID=A0A8X7P3E8_BRACI|nr:hypothetical protein Bca52824_094956 [Brassica carinata]
MAIFNTQNTWAIAFGLLGNIISFAVPSLQCKPTFYRIWKKKTTEDFQSLPYVVSLFSGMLWLYYATQKKDVFLLVTVNSFCCFIRTIYIAIFVAFATKKARMLTVKLLLLMNFGRFCLILLLCQFLAKESTRAKIIGGICAGFSVCVFAAPLSIIRTVIKTKSVEYMPFSLSLTLTISAVVWFLYGLALKDIYVAKELEAANLPEVSIDMLNVGALASPEPAEITVVPTASKCTCIDRKAETENGHGIKNGTHSTSAY